jgi:hypothetical protein
VAFRRDAGWWHFGWNLEDGSWTLTQPDGNARPRLWVLQRDWGYPPAALIGSVPGLLLEPIITAIIIKGLFPPRSTTT